MELLTKQSLDTAIKKCLENEGYQVLIVTEHAENGDDIVSFLAQNYDALACRRRTNPYAQFPNRSSIRIISLASNVRDYKADFVLCAKKIFNDIDMRHIIQTAEIPRTKFYDEVQL